MPLSGIKAYQKTFRERYDGVELYKLSTSEPAIYLNQVEIIRNKIKIRQLH